MENDLVMEINHIGVTALSPDLKSKDVICRFNGFWPKLEVLHQCILTLWMPNCDIYLCSKYFFNVQFDTKKEMDTVLNYGPWLLGNAGLFITPGFPEFDATTMVVSTMPIWVRLPNLPLPCWDPKFIEDIGNKLRKFKKMDNERIENGIFTFARICVEMDLSKGLPGYIKMKHKDL